MDERTWLEGGTEAAWLEGLRREDRQERDMDNEPLIRIIYTAADVEGLAEAAGVDPEVAMTRAREWAKHITSTATELIGEQLANVVETGQP